MWGLPVCCFVVWQADGGGAHMGARGGHVRPSPLALPTASFVTYTRLQAVSWRWLGAAHKHTFSVFDHKRRNKRLPPIASQPQTHHKRVVLVAGQLV